MSDQITNRIPPEHPASTPTPHPQGSQKALVLGFILFALVAIGLGGYALYSTFDKVKKGPTPRSTPELGEPVATFTGEELHREYDANQIAFEQKYAGKTVRATGVISLIGEFEDGPATYPAEAYLFLVDKLNTPWRDGTACLFAKKDDIIQIQSGASISIEGTVTKNHPKALHPRLFNCTIRD